MEIRIAYPNEIQRIMEIIQDAKESQMKTLFLRIF